ncbi:hypothetical protein AMTR_s00096p00127740 [Amborella trichopoda]|uniref:Uncharacterized protein n=1 Tax=Amborella trichopoda TaxID=13333 RepID=W1P3C4_AMBTC|nr:hypothetical protein AMTR_s00096p00127740 [Amborella trichopoda]
MSSTCGDRRITKVSRFPVMHLLSDCKLVHPYAGPVGLPFGADSFLATSGQGLDICCGHLIECHENPSQNAIII